MSVVNVGAHISKASGRGEEDEEEGCDDDDDDVGVACADGDVGKVKSNAIPASEAAPKNGIVRRSAPRDTSRRIFCGVAGSLNTSLTRRSSPSGITVSDADSYKARPETREPVSSSSSSDR